VRDDRALVLLAIPRTLAAQPASDLVQARKRQANPLLGRAHTGSVAIAYGCESPGRPGAMPCGPSRSTAG
jgi:hypothetical protein